MGQRLHALKNVSDEFLFMPHDAAFGCWQSNLSLHASCHKTTFIARVEASGSLNVRLISPARFAPHELYGPGIRCGTFDMDSIYH